MVDRRSASSTADLTYSPVQNPPVRIMCFTLGGFEGLNSNKLEDISLFDSLLLGGCGASGQLTKISSAVDPIKSQIPAEPILPFF